MIISLYCIKRKKKKNFTKKKKIQTFIFVSGYSYSIGWVASLKKYIWTFFSLPKKRLIKTLSKTF
jgi:hypothetical protein